MFRPPTFSGGPVRRENGGGAAQKMYFCIDQMLLTLRSTEYGVVCQAARYWNLWRKQDRAQVLSVNWYTFILLLWLSSIRYLKVTRISYYSPIFPPNLFVRMELIISIQRSLTSS